MVLLRARLLVAVVAALLLPTVALAHESVDHAKDQVDQAEQKAEQARQRAQRLQEQTDEARQQVRQLEDEIPAAEQRVAQAEQKVEEIQPRLDRASRELEAAEERAERAEEQAEVARRKAEAAQERLQESLALLQENEDQRASVARDAYKHGPGANSAEVVALQMAEGASPNDMAELVHVLDVLLLDHNLLVKESVELAEETRDRAQEAEEAQREREAEAEQAKQAREEASQQHAQMLTLMAEAEDAHLAAQQARDDLAARKAAAEQLAAALGDKADRAQQSVQQRLNAVREANNALREAREAAEAAAAARTQPVSSAGGVSVYRVNSFLMSVGGITVHESIAGQVESLLNAARADGIVLGGYGYRSPETTARLRRANGCPDVYTSPASSCRVPTARPGSSMHEKGLAIDFSWNGSTICYPNPPSRCYGNAAFDWLRANAGKYGLYGLSSEAWHWSTNGN